MTLKLTHQSFCTTLQLILMHHHTKYGCIWLSGSFSDGITCKKQKKICHTKTRSDGQCDSHRTYPSTPNSFFVCVLGCGVRGGAKICVCSYTIHRYWTKYSNIIKTRKSEYIENLLPKHKTSTNPHPPHPTTPKKKPSIPPKKSVTVQNSFNKQHYGQ